MISYIEKKEQWYKHFATLPVDEQYDMFMDLLEQNVPDDELIEDDFGSVFVDLKSDLVKEKQYEKAINLIEKTRESTSKFYQKEFPYSSNFAVEYYLYTKDFDKAHAHLQPFITKPGHGYDMFTPLYDKIRFYQMDELALKLANILHEPIMESSELIVGAESDLTNLIFYNVFQEFYTTSEQNRDMPSYQQLKDTVKKFEFDETLSEGELSEIYHTLTADKETPIFTSNEWDKMVQDNPNRAKRNLYWQFAIYMLKRGNFHFSISANIWFSYCKMLLEKESLANFSFQYQDLDELIGRFFGFFSNEEERGFAVLWGIPYIYDFLRDQQLVTNEVYDRALEYVADIKENLIKLYENDIWRFDFVHTWVRPLSISAETFTEEEKLFHQTFMNRTRKKSSPSKTGSRSPDQLSLFDDLFTEKKE
ncbi:hypothetical protein ACW2QC_03555 [Virgibacillus sp. FSP13]